MKGAYILTKQVLDSGSGQHVFNVQQWKMFTDKYVVYAHRRSETDSMAEFGVGTYHIANGKVVEEMFHGATGPMQNTFQLNVSKQNDGYTQVINFHNNAKTYILTEDYITSGKNLKTPLDGAWRMTRLTQIDKTGKTTDSETNADEAQFKFYEGGSFIWVNQWKDAKTGKQMSAYGYGTTRVDAPDQITESNVSSTYATILNGRDVTLKLKFFGPDVYEQTIVFPGGGQSTERYERMK
jgi:hypothetical protein